MARLARPKAMGAPLASSRARAMAWFISSSWGTTRLYCQDYLPPIAQATDDNQQRRLLFLQARLYIYPVHPQEDDFQPLEAGAASTAPTPPATAP